MDYDFILASASPRRFELLRNVGAKFIVKPSDCDESGVEGSGAERVSALSLLKCRDIAKRYPDIPVLGADTLVEAPNGSILGKPKDRNDAVQMIKMLSGAVHTVHTGVTTSLNGEYFTGVESARVSFRKLAESEIEAYVNSGEPEGKAGAYAIQGLGSLLIDCIEGDFFTIVGLPMVLSMKLLQAVGVRLL